MVPYYFVLFNSKIYLRSFFVYIDPDKVNCFSVFREPISPHGKVFSGKKHLVSKNPWSTKSWPTHSDPVWTRFLIDDSPCGGPQPLIGIFFIFFFVKIFQKARIVCKINLKFFIFFPFCRKIWILKIFKNLRIFFFSIFKFFCILQKKINEIFCFYFQG